MNRHYKYYGGNLNPEWVKVCNILNASGCLSEEFKDRIWHVIERATTTSESAEPGRELHKARIEAIREDMENLTIFNSSFIATINQLLFAGLLKEIDIQKQGK